MGDLGVAQIILLSPEKHKIEQTCGVKIGIFDIFSIVINDRVKKTFLH